MANNCKSPEEYISKTPEERHEILNQLRKTIGTSLSKVFEEGMQYGMISYFVPHSIYPDGYHCNPKEPLPFMSFASQKNSINLYHMGMYAMPEIHDWFVSEYPKYSKYKLDMGKSCVRFKKIEHIPLELIAQLCKKLTAAEWITVYESEFKKS
ncbi:DUF1801 domain-containing protein [Bizionia myxarmorum]|uniref:DUF1801 domain-containing protein n=1 Tax=Bizionia myxarmorum TaxID=291186 RepID=A0A5D0RAK8_9FLAO|nr:DUF1801 domain-containing protein [Bizionia myxarmorum]TYB78527.1 DUF1801 domain-containing protein [Bizionia myxarmorum]